MGLEINKEKCTECLVCIEICPFGGISSGEEGVEFNSACKVCRLCIKACPVKAISFEQERTETVCKDDYQGVLVFVEHTFDEIHPVTYELINKGRELANSLGQSLSCLFVGSEITHLAKELLAYDVDAVYVYDHLELANFRIEPYTAVLEDIQQRKRFSIILAGATPLGRSLAPRAAARFRTGLTADCTVLNVKDDTDLVQIRPAFGGNIMAQIVTPKHRPQMATVRYKVMNPAPKLEEPRGQIEIMPVEERHLFSHQEVMASHPKPQEDSITEAEIVIAVGRGLKEEKDLLMAKQLADLLGGKVGVTRPLVEQGWADHTRQIGLSGRTIRPKLLIALGISGAVQFTASVSGAEHIMAINQDADAPIFQIAHYGIVGDLYEIVPQLIANLERGHIENGIKNAEVG